MSDFGYDPIALVAGLNSKPLAFSSRAITRRTLPEALVLQLREMIDSGELLPGARISMQRLCRRFNVSRTPLREALKILAGEGLILLSPNKSAKVLPLTRKAISELLTVIATLEALAGRVACAHIDGATIERIRSLHDQIVDCCRRRTEAGCYELYDAINDALFEAAGNDTLTETYRSLRRRLRPLQTRHAMRLRFDEIVADHERLIGALETRQEQLAELVLEHRRRWSLGNIWPGDDTR